MEVEIPVGKEPGWTKIRVERAKGSPGGTNKRITVENCPLKVRLEPWLEGKKPSRKPSLEGAAFGTADTKHGDRMAYEASVRSSKLSISIALP